MPVPVTRGGQRVDREHLIPRGDQRRDEQPPVSLDPDHHLARIVAVPGGQLMEPGDPLHTLGQPPAGQPPALRIHQQNVMMSLSPVNSSKDHPDPPRPQQQR